MRCRLCGSALQPVHGHGACLTSGCPMFGLNQDECCNGETCEMPLDPERAASADGPSTAPGSGELPPTRA